jgi:hypothetical protein
MVSCGLPLDTNSIPHFGQNVNRQNAQSLRKKIAEIGYFAEKPGATVVGARRNLCAKCTKGKEGFHPLTSPAFASKKPTHTPSAPNKD